MLSPGTEHEIHVAHEAWKRSGAPQIMIYFNEQSAFPGSSVGAVQWAHVLRFKENFPKEGLWWAYEGHTQFERLVRNHLTQYVRDRFSLLEDAAGRVQVLTLRDTSLRRLTRHRMDLCPVGSL